MPNLVEVTYEQTGKSKKTNSFGMREMQERAFTPSNKEEFIKSIISFWGESIKEYKEVEVNGETGIEIVYKKEGKDKISRFEAFPKKYGKGEWKAETLEDAKQMAIDFANSVS